MKRMIISLRNRWIGAGEAGFTTAELLGNAAMGVLALVVIWAALEVAGVEVVNWIKGQLMSGG
jgi:hypothetical protein